MEVVSTGMYWEIKNTRGPVPTALRGEWTSKASALNAIEVFQKGVQSRALNVSQRNRERKNKDRNETSPSEQNSD